MGLRLKAKTRLVTFKFGNPGSESCELYAIIHALAPGDLERQQGSCVVIDIPWGNHDADLTAVPEAGVSVEEYARRLALARH